MRETILAEHHCTALQGKGRGKRYILEYSFFSHSYRCFSIMGESYLCYLFRCRIDRRSKMSSQASNSDVRLRNSNLTFCMTVKSSFSFERVNLSEFTKKVRVHDCKYRESLARLKKSKILITCQKNSFGELSSKKIVLTLKNI